MTASTEYRFGEFRLLPQEQQVLRGGAAVALTARAFSLLLVLVESAGQLLSKDVLMQNVWAGLVVEENNLAVQIGVLRKLLGADSIVTVPSRGYRFTLNVQATAPVPPKPVSGNLPVATGLLLGRDADLLALHAHRQQHRLVTVVGAGGIGKSRLALAAARAEVGRWRDGVWWLELAGLRDPALLALSMAQTLGLGLQGRDAGPSALATTLAGHEALLVIDNCEHVLDAAAELVERLLQAAPGLCVLATSQEPLRLSCEQQYRLNPLDVPRDAATPDARSFSAVALLVSRVRAAVPQFSLSDDDLPLAIDLCRRLDGLPLAIELAAARIPMLGLRTVHDHLDERFRLLTTGSRTALPRHQTLHAALAWSHGLLDDPQRGVFMRLGVFSGGFTMALVQALCAQDGMDQWVVLEQLAALVEKSLVVLDSGPGSRYRLLESARAYALEQLAAVGMTPMCQQHHALTMLGFVRGVDDANLDGALRTDEYAARMLPELDNLRAAYAWADGPGGDRQVAIGLAAHVGSLIDYSLEFVAWLLAQRPHVERGGVSNATAARFWRGLAAMNMVGYLSVADQLCAAERCAVLYRALGLPKRIFTALRRVAVWAVSLDNHERAGAALDEAQAVMLPDWSPEFQIELLRGRAVLASHAGQLDTALALNQEALRLARDVMADWRLEVMQQTNVADLLWEAGRYAEAADMLGELIRRLYQQPASDYELMDALESRLWILSEAGEKDSAIAVAREALPVLRRMPRFSLVGCAHLLLHLGRPEDAARVLGAHAARARAGLGHLHVNPARLLRSAEAGVQAALPPERLLALRSNGEGLDSIGVCALLAEALATV